MYGLCRVRDPGSGAPRVVLISWVSRGGDGGLCRANLQRARHGWAWGGAAGGAGGTGMGRVGAVPAALSPASVPGRGGGARVPAPGVRRTPARHQSLLQGEPGARGGSIQGPHPPLPAPQPRPLLAAACGAFLELLTQALPFPAPSSSSQFQPWLRCGCGWAPCPGPVLPRPRPAPSALPCPVGLGLPPARAPIPALPGARSHVWIRPHIWIC